MRGVHLTARQVAALTGKAGKGNAMKCPTCGNGELMNSNGGLFCRECWNVAEVSQTTATNALRATHTEKRRLDDIPVIDCEKALVREITLQLTRRGWKVYHIGQLVARGSGSTPGVPDLMCVKPACRPYPAMVRLIEVKFGKNKPTTEQQELIDAGAACAVWSVREALDYCEEA
jgi:hypothetical protein